MTFFLNEPCFEAVIVIEAGIVNKQLFAEVEVTSGGYLQSRFGEVNIHCYSLTLRRIIALVYTTQV